jgi:hypothetical protein
MAVRATLSDRMKTNRRHFLRRAAWGGTGFFLLEAAGSAWSAQANHKLNIALVGVGGRGSWFVGAIPRLGENLVALCDVDDAKNPDAYQQLPRARKFHDFRRMLDTMGEGIDAVIVATPDHTHAVASAAALRAGKPVFCEKPLTRTVHESRALRKLARQHQLATSMGNQGTAAGPFRRALELIRTGTIGDVKEVHIWNSEGGADRQEPPSGGAPVPEGLDWDLWLGPVAYRPYHRAWLQRNAWRDFGTCQLGNWLLACRGGPPAWANFDYADALNEFLMLGNVSTRFEPGTRLEFHPVAMTIVNHPAADALLRCDYRSGWTL